MRTRTEEEKRAMGLLDPIFRDLGIKKATRGYVPLMDLACYAYANPNKKFGEIIDYLGRENSYIGVKTTSSAEEIAMGMECALIPSMERTIETALEGTSLEILAMYDLDKLSVLVQDRNIQEQEKMEEQLLADLGEKYNEYSTHNERVIIFFVKKLLRHITQ